MNVTMIMLVVYMAITIGISLYFRKRNSDSKGFMTAKGELGVILVIPLLFSELIAGAGTIGNAQKSYHMGFSSVWADWGLAIGVILFVLLALKFYKGMNKEKGVISVPEAYKYMFDEKCRIVMLFVIVITYMILFSNQPAAVGAIIGPLFGVNETVVAWVAAAIFILVTLSGGMKGIAFMNVLHAVIMMVGMVIISYKSVHYAGGMDVLHAVLPETYFSFMQPNVPTTIANGLGTAISMLAAATAVTVSFTAKDLRTARLGMPIAALIVAPFALCPSLVGMCAKVVLPDIDPSTALFSMAHQLGGIYSGVTSMAIIAAIWSTAPVLLMIASTTLTRDFYKKIKPEATDAQELRASRLCVVLVGVVGTILGLSADSFLDQMYGAFQIRSIVAITLLVALFWPRVSTRAAFWSMLLGGVTAAVWFFAGNPMGISCFWPGAVICLAILVILTLMSREKVSAGYQLYQEAVAAMMAEEKSNRISNTKEDV